MMVSQVVTALALAQEFREESRKEEETSNWLDSGLSRPAQGQSRQSPVPPTA